MIYLNSRVSHGHVWQLQVQSVDILYFGDKCEAFEAIFGKGCFSIWSLRTGQRSVSGSVNSEKQKSEKRRENLTWKK